MQDERARVLEPAAAQRAGECGGNGAAHAAIGQVQHEHQEGQDQREARQRLGAEPADEPGLGDGDEDLHHHEGGGGAGQPQQRGPDGCGEKGMERQEGLRK